jgi:hypothetical protein
MKGKDTYTSAEINKLKELINLRIRTPSSGQKSIRDKMRAIGFYGKDDWGITDLQIADLNSLITSNRIKVVDRNFNQPPLPLVKVKVTSKPVETSFAIINSTDLESILISFENNHFDPQVHIESRVNNEPGNYIVCLRKDSKLPKISATPVFTNFAGLDVIYTGIASISLRTRDYRQHFKGNNAGRSTLRKSLGSLFGYKQIPRDKDPNSGKTKFNDQDEQRLSEWMHSNLIMFTLHTTNFKDIEIQLINHFNPPLNLKDNKNPINSDFRRLLSVLRTTKPI